MATTLPFEGDALKKTGAYFTPLLVQPQDQPSLSVTIQPGSYFNSTGVLTQYSGTASLPLTPPVSGVVWAVIVIDDSAVPTAIYGTAGATADLPSIPSNVLPLAAVFLSGGMASVTSSSIADIRPYLETPRTIDGTSGTSLILNANDTALQSNAYLTVKRGPGMTDVAIRWNISANSGAGAWELTNDGVTYYTIPTSSTTGSLTHNDITDWTTAVTAAINAAPLNALSGVSVTTPVASQSLIYNGTDWVNEPLSKALLTDFVESDYVHTTLDESISGNKTFQNDINVVGNVTLGQPGTDTFINSDVFAVRPAFTTLNQSGISQDVGFTVNRGTNTAAQLLWSETSQTWKLGLAGSLSPILSQTYVDTKQITAGAGLTGGGTLSASPVTLSLAAVGTPVTDQFVSITTDGYGRVTATSPVASSQITNTMMAGANTFLAGAINGIPTAPTFRTIDPSDLPATGVVPGQYTLATVTVDSQGRITQANSGATTVGVDSILAGTGITISQPSGTVTVSNSGVLSVNGRSGAVTLTPVDAGLGNVVNSLQVVNGGGVVSIQENLYAAIPAAGTTGRLFIGTDNKLIYRDNGTTWDQVGGGVLSFNTRTGPVTLVSTDITTALGFTPYSNANPNSYFANPMTTAGDVIVGGSNGAATRLGIGTPGQALIVSGTSLAWGAPSLSGVALTGYSETAYADGNSSAAVTLNLANGNTHSVTLTSNCTISVIGAPAAGYAATITLFLTQDSTGGRTVTWPTTTKWSSGTAPVLSTAPAAIDVFTLTSFDGGSTWFGFVLGKGMA